MGFLNGIYLLIIASYVILSLFSYHGHGKILNSDWLELKRFDSQAQEECFNVSNRK